MLRPIHHDRPLTRRAAPTPATAATRPSSDTPSEALTPATSPPLTASEKDDLFRRFDSYMAHPENPAGSVP